MSVPIRGRCLVINNFNFGPSASSDGNRDGSSMDVDNISNVFKDLSFVVEKHTDLSATEMEGVIHRETQHNDHANYGMFVLIIMSHGTENKVYGTDGNTVSLPTIYHYLSLSCFPAMTGKPKLIIVQACSGERLDTQGRTVHDALPTGDMPRVTPLPSPPANRPVAISRPPGEYSDTDDFYIMNASFPGYVSWRHTRSGSWFVRALVEALYKHACHRDIQTVFQQVRKKVKKKGGQQPIDMHSFTNNRKLYLFP